MTTMRTIVGSLALLAAVLVVLGLLFGLGFGVITSGDVNSQTEYAKSFGFLILIALFIDRASAVLVSVSSSPEAKLRATLDLEGTQAKLKHLATVDSSEFQGSAKRAAVEEAVDRVKNHAFALKLIQKEEDFKASAVSVLLGFIIAIAGVHAMELFIAANALGNGYHRKIFLAADILLTGLLLGGGAAGIRAIWNTVSAGLKTPSDLFPLR